MTLSDIGEQVVGLYADLKLAVQADPKAPAGAATRSLLRKLAEQAKTQVRGQSAVDSVISAIDETTSTAMSVSDALALTGQLMRALRTKTP